MEYVQFETELKNNVALILSYIKEVWANNDEKVYQYMLKWLSNMISGKKNKTCIMQSLYKELANQLYQNL